jgi:hypothetical protein
MVYRGHAAPQHRCWLGRHAEVDCPIRMDLGRSAVDLDPEPEALAAAPR